MQPLTACTAAADFGFREARGDVRSQAPGSPDPSTGTRAQGPRASRQGLAQQMAHEGGEGFP